MIRCVMVWKIMAVLSCEPWNERFIDEKRISVLCFYAWSCRLNISFSLLTEKDVTCFGWSCLSSNERQNACIVRLQSLIFDVSAREKKSRSASEVRRSIATMSTPCCWKFFRKTFDSSQYICRSLPKNFRYGTTQFKSQCGIIDVVSSWQ